MLCFSIPTVVLCVKNFTVLTYTKYAYLLCHVKVVYLLHVFPDRAVLKNPGIVEHCQAVLLCALEFLVRRNHPGDRWFIPKVITILTEMRTLTELQRSWEETIDMDWSSEFQFPPLLYEIASSS